MDLDCYLPTLLVYLLLQLRFVSFCMLPSLLASTLVESGSALNFLFELCISIYDNFPVAFFSRIVPTEADLFLSLTVPLP